MKLLIIRLRLLDLTSQVGAGFLQSQHPVAKDIDLQQQRAYRDILVCHRQGYTVLPSFAPPRNPSFENISSQHSVNGYTVGYNSTQSGENIQ